MPTDPMSLTIEPIENAPVEPNVEFGPCLLSPGSDHGWTIGRWNGEGWYDENGLPLTPAGWALLPQR
jgi:hypothetical protein